MKQRLLGLGLFLFSLFITTLSFAQIDPSGGRNTANDPAATNLIQRIYNALSIAIAIGSVIYYAVAVKGLISTDPKQKEEKNAHIQQLIYVTIGVLIWYLGVPFLFTLGSK